MGICCSSKHQEYEGKVEYTNQNYVEIEKAIIEGDKAGLKAHFENGFRTHHKIKDDKNDKRFLNLIVEKNRIDTVSEFPITVDLKTLLADEYGKKFYETLLSNKAVLKNFYDHYSHDEKVEYRAKGKIQNNEIHEYLQHMEPQKDDDPFHPVYKFLIENIFQKAVDTQITPYSESYSPNPSSKFRSQVAAPLDENNDNDENHSENFNGNAEKQKSLEKDSQADNVQAS